MFLERLKLCWIVAVVALGVGALEVFAFEVDSALAMEIVGCEVADVVVMFELDVDHMVERMLIKTIKKRGRVCGSK